MIQELDRIRANQTKSGYIYLHIPSRISRQFNINGTTWFSILFDNGRIMVRQEDYAPGLGSSKARAG